MLPKSYLSQSCQCLKSCFVFTISSCRSMIVSLQSCSSIYLSQSCRCFKSCFVFNLQLCRSMIVSFQSCSCICDTRSSLYVTPIFSVDSIVPVEVSLALLSSFNSWENHATLISKPDCLPLWFLNPILSSAPSSSLHFYNVRSGQQVLPSWCLPTRWCLFPSQQIDLNFICQNINGWQATDDF